MLSNNKEGQLIKVKKRNEEYFIKTNIPYELKPNLDFDGTLNYLSERQLITVNVPNIPDLIKKGLITSVKQTVHALDSTPTLEKDGFEVRPLPDEIQALLTHYRKSTPDEQHKLREVIRDKLESLASKHFNLPVVAFDTVYRNTNEEKNNAFKSILLVHIDFPQNKLAATFDVFNKEWEPRVRKKLGDKYHIENLKFMINIWMPLDTVTASPLVLCSNETIQPDRLHEYDAVRRDQATFKAVSLTPPKAPKQDPWVYKPGMKGWCYLFSSTKGIHSATTFPGETGSRESIEVRLGVFGK